VLQKVGQLLRVVAGNASSHAHTFQGDLPARKFA